MVEIKMTLRIIQIPAGEIWVENVPAIMRWQTEGRSFFSKTFFGLPLVRVGLSAPDPGHEWSADQMMMMIAIKMMIILEGDDH